MSFSSTNQSATVGSVIDMATDRPGGPSYGAAGTSIQECAAALDNSVSRICN
jgi:hypothetical protein